MNTRPIAAPLGALALVSVVALSLVGCSTRTRVELESASAPVVQPVDGGDGQNAADVVDAGAIAIDQPVVESTTTEATTTTIDPSAPTSTKAPKVEVDDATKQLCRNEKRTLKTAVEDYRADQGTAPMSEGDLIAFAYVRTASSLYDVRFDGSVVAEGDTCVGVR